LRFLVTGALLIGPAVQGCDDFYGDEPMGNEMAPIVEAPVPNEMEDPAPPPDEIPPPEAVAPEPGIEAPDPGVEAPEAELDDGVIETGAAVMTTTNAVAPPRPK
jgi:hypothetical protein